jgi:hypothetical protein
MESRQNRHPTDHHGAEHLCAHASLSPVRSDRTDFHERFHVGSHLRPHAWALSLKSTVTAHIRRRTETSPGGERSHRAPYSQRRSNHDYIPQHEPSKQRTATGLWEGRTARGDRYAPEETCHEPAVGEQPRRVRAAAAPDRPRSDLAGARVAPPMARCGVRAAVGEGRFARPGIRRPSAARSGATATGTGAPAVVRPTGAVILEHGPPTRTGRHCLPR